MIENVRNIVSIVTEVTGITKEQIIGKDRHLPIVDARKLAISLLRDYSDATFTQIGVMFKKHHSTIMHACEVTKDLIIYDRSFARKYLRAQKEVEKLGMTKVTRDKSYLFGNRKKAA